VRRTAFDDKRARWFEQRAKSSRRHQAANAEHAARLRAAYLEGRA
jgi:hypothetical protein